MHAEFHHKAKASETLSLFFFFVTSTYFGILLKNLWSECTMQTRAQRTSKYETNNEF